MATLAFAAVGTSLGGPIGGLVGGMVGRQVDSALFGGRNRDGPRLDDLRATRSTYGTPIPRHFGRMRVPGTIIWATDLVEHSETTGSGKGGGSVTIYSYSASFAVALASRPIIAIGRIWADGDLLRGEAGDLKVGGALRIHTGHGDQALDPLMAQAEGARCPAYRGTAHVVFEDLELSTFGNRIPALTFEVIADEGDLTLADMLTELGEPVSATVELPGLRGFSDEGGAAAEMLGTIDALFPMACDGGVERLALMDAVTPPSDPPVLSEATASEEDGAFSQQDGQFRRRKGRGTPGAIALRYYDPQRDYLAGMQRSAGHAPAGPVGTIEFPGALAAIDARELASRAADRARWASETLAWRTATLDPAIRPGSIVRAPGMVGLWRVTGWEWNNHGVELELLRLPAGLSPRSAADHGAARPPADLVTGPTLLTAFELPWDGSGAADRPALYAAASSAYPGWRGAPLYREEAGTLVPLGTARRRAVIGHSTSPLPASPALLLEREATVLVQLAASDLVLSSATPAALAGGANRALLGGELLQFLEAIPLGSGTWRLRGLLRGRGGTEGAAQAGHPADTGFVFVGDTLVPLDPGAAGHRLAALGLGDSDPVIAPILNTGLSRKPLSPVHPVARSLADGGMLLGWTRRARGAWLWDDEVDAPLVEETEAYRIGIGPVAAPPRRWDTTASQLMLNAVLWAELRTAHPGMPVWVRQIGRHALSDPLLLTTLT